MRIEAFSPLISESQLLDLKKRIASTRWPKGGTTNSWDRGADLDYLKSLLEYWANDFDIGFFQKALAQYDHFMAKSEGLNIHFIHARSAKGLGIPIILSHGWPSNFIEYLSVIPILTDPSAYGLEGTGFDVVIPSLPGYAFSDRQPKHRTRETARVWHELMNTLGYSKFAVHGSDFGAGVSTFLALDFPESVIGLHLTNIENSPELTPLSEPLSNSERLFLQKGENWFEEEGGYKIIQRTRPQTLAFGLSDSPAGLAAWVLDKWRSWSDCGGDIDKCFGRQFLISLLTIFWLTNSMGTSINDYYDNKQTGYILKASEYVKCPAAIAVFDNSFVEEAFPPKEWVMRMYNVVRWTKMAKGGHFAAAEQPLLFANDVLEFFASIKLSS